MKTAARSSDDARLRRSEAIVTRHVREMFERLPMLVGFCLRPDLRIAELSICPWPDDIDGPELYGLVMQSLVELAEAHPEAVRLMRGRTFARSVH